MARSNYSGYGNKYKDWIIRSQVSKAKLKKAKRKVQRLGALWVPELVGPSGAADIAAGFKTTEMGDTLFFL